jgi:hypothetical protein
MPDKPARAGIVILHGAGSCKESHHDFARAAIAAGFAAIAYLSPDLGVKVVLLCVLVVEVVCLREGVALRSWMIRRKAGGMGVWVWLRGRPALSGPAAAGVGGR